MEIDYLSEKKKLHTKIVQNFLKNKSVNNLHTFTFITKFKITQYKIIYQQYNKDILSL